MRAINALQIQEDLRNRKYITVPWLQLEYGLSYREAKDFLRQLQNRGWASRTARGIYYAVCPKMLCLRRIRREEVDALYSGITNDCVLALNCLEKLAGAGATEGELERAIRGDDDTQTAIRILTRLKLIYKAEDLYFLMVSAKTVQVLWEVEMEKRKSTLRRRITESEEESTEEKKAKIKKLFDVLFED